MDSKPTRESIFFYGLFMDADLLREKGLNPEDFKLACAAGYGLRLGERATLQISTTEKVFGSIMKLKADELDRLYGEESVADYVPIELTASDMEGKQIDAISYILPIEMLSGRNPKYAKALLSVAVKIGLPENYLRTIKAWI